MRDVSASSSPTQTAFSRSFRVHPIPSEDPALSASFRSWSRPRKPLPDSFYTRRSWKDNTAWKREKQLSGHVFDSLVHHLDLNLIHPTRAGVIPYTFCKGRMLFGFGLDARHRELTDFGGGVSYKKDLNAIAGALREFSEESLNVFGPIAPEIVHSSYVIYNSYMLIVFLPFHVDPLEKNRLFYARLSSEPNPEVQDILWLTEEELRAAMQSQSRLLYARVRKFLSQARDFISVLKSFQAE